jgi:hypothetical protein
MTLGTQYFRLWCPSHPWRRSYRGRHEVQVRRLAVAGASQGVHPLGPLHQEQVRRGSHLQQARPHGSPLPAGVKKILYLYVFINMYSSIYIYLYIFIYIHYYCTLST